jgi:hypothetical protein
VTSVGADEGAGHARYTFRARVPATARAGLEAEWGLPRRKKKRPEQPALRCTRWGVRLRRGRRDRRSNPLAVGQRSMRYADPTAPRRPPRGFSTALLPVRIARYTFPGGTYRAAGSDQKKGHAA